MNLNQGTGDMHVVHAGLHSDAVRMDYQESISYSNCFILNFQIHAIDYFLDFKSLFNGSDDITVMFYFVKR